MATSMSRALASPEQETLAHHKQLPKLNGLLPGTFLTSFKYDQQTGKTEIILSTDRVTMTASKAETI